jgi:hypothetical protein
MSAGKRLGAAALAIIALIFAAVAFGGGAASAYPSGTAPTISLDHSSGPVGDSVIVSGAHFTPGKSASLVFHSSPINLTTVTASSSGTFTVTIKIPSDPLGAHYVQALDEDSATFSNHAAFTITGSGTSGGGGLANTGVAVLGIASLGLVLLVGGSLMLMAGRRRKVAA